MKTCRTCKQEKPDNEVRKGECRACRTAYIREWKQRNRERTAEIKRKSFRKRCAEDPTVVVRKQLTAAKHRCLKRGIPFDITLEDVLPVPDVCPALGIPLSRAGGKCSPGLPELDRLIPSLGYVRGNVVWLSRRANTIKNDANHEELYKIAEWLREQLPKTHPV